MKLELDRNCFACGPDNKCGLGLVFMFDGPDAVAEFTPDIRFMGYAGIVHGGIVSALLDEAMAYASGKTLGAPAATAELTVRFLLPLHVGQHVHVRGRVLRHSARLAYCESEVTAPGGQLIARATAKLLKLD